MIVTCYCTIFGEQNDCNLLLYYSPEGHNDQNFGVSNCSVTPLVALTVWISVKNVGIHVAELRGYWTTFICCQ